MNMAKNDFANAGKMPETLPANGAGQQILCDCDGTLFNAKHRNGKGLNLELLDFLVAAQKRGYQVIVHSGSPSSNENNMALYSRMTQRFAQFMEDVSMAAPFGTDAVVDKGVTDSTKAVLTIDDRHDIDYISKAPNQWEPNDARMHTTMAAWGEPWVSAVAKGGPTPPTP